MVKKASWIDLLHSYNGVSCILSPHLTFSLLLSLPLFCPNLHYCSRAIVSMYCNSSLAVEPAALCKRKNEVIAIKSLYGGLKYKRALQCICNCQPSSDHSHGVLWTMFSLLISNSPLCLIIKLLSPFSFLALNC